MKPGTYELGQGECVERMRSLRGSFFDLIFADPPFNVGYDAYDSTDDKLKDEDYMSWSSSWIEQCLRILKPTGSFWIAIGDEYVSELDMLVKQKLPRLQKGWVKRAHVLWYYTFGVNCSNNFARSHTHLLYYSHKKGKKRTFNASDPEIRHPSSRQLVYNDKRANPDGRLPDNTWVLSPLDLAKAFTPAEDTWLASRIAGTFHERAARGTTGEQRAIPQMPAVIMERIVRACSKPGDEVLDPFSGNGTTGAAAVSLGRNFTGIDLSEACVRMSRALIEKALSKSEGTGAWQSNGETNGAKTQKKKSPQSSTKKKLKKKARKTPTP